MAVPSSTHYRIFSSRRQLSCDTCFGVLWLPGSVYCSCYCKAAASLGHSLDPHGIEVVLTKPEKTGPGFKLIFPLWRASPCALAPASRVGAFGALHKFRYLLGNGRNTAIHARGRKSPKIAFKHLCNGFTNRSSMGPDAQMQSLSRRNSAAKRPLPTHISPIHGGGQQ